MPKNGKFINREISWLSFNERVLQEAEDPGVPLIQRFRFLGIFSNNLDEFFRVRVATMRRMVNLGQDKNLLGNKSPQEVLEEIQRIVVQQQKRLGKIYNQLLQELEKYNIFVIEETKVDEEQGAFIRKYFRNKVSLSIVPMMIQHTAEFPYLNDDFLYFAIKLSKNDNSKKPVYSIIEVNTEVLPRFILLPPKNKKTYIIILDDIIRYCLDDIFAGFDYDKIDAYTVKVTRDAELDIDDDISTSFIDKMSKSLKRRKKGKAVRFVYDYKIPKDILNYITKKMPLDSHDNLIAGGRYHNFRDFIKFPSVGPKKIENNPTPPIKSKYFRPFHSIIEVVRKRDVVLHYPYQSFSHYIDFLREAAIDVDVTFIGITIYRVARRSSVINALINAAKNGKKVTAVVELQARFDERANIKWANRLEEEGVKVVFGVPGLKVHSKITLVKRKENGKIKNYAYLGTGNFHEGTARVYCDDGIFTSHPEITNEVSRLFDFFHSNYKLYPYKHLVVSPFNTRTYFKGLIDNEIEQAQKNRKALIIIKLNSLVDEEMISKLYEASQAGVKIQLIIRGICSLIPGIPGISENIEAISIVDKYLEHSRIILFHNKGKELLFISSADWMTRNLDYRIEVTCPVYDKEIKEELKQMLRIQLSDNTKARLHCGYQLNKYKNDGKKRKIRSQINYYNYLRRKLNKNSK